MNQPTQSPAVPQQIALVRQELPNLQAIIALNARPGTDVATIAAQELQFLEQIAVTVPALYECEPFSVVMAVKSVMRWNLTLDPRAGLVYAKARNVKINNQWKKVLEIDKTANGLISYNRQIGRILDYKEPKVVKNAEGRVIGGSIEILKPSYPQPRWEIYEYDESDFRRWMSYSHKENARSYKGDSGKPEPDEKTLNYANQLYTSQCGGVDKEFAKSKIIKHSLKKLGANQNETGAIRVYDVEPVAIVDPRIDAIASADGEFTPHEDIGSTPLSDQTQFTDLPSIDDL